MRTDDYDGGPAFPYVEMIVHSHDYTEERHMPGMSLRDCIAKEAMGALIDTRLLKPDPRQAMEDVAYVAYGYADAMLKARAFITADRVIE